MKKEYDFSKGERGKFYTPNTELNIPIYLEPDNLRFIRNIAAKKKSDLSSVVNNLIKTDIQLAKIIE